LTKLINIDALVISPKTPKTPSPLWERVGVRVKVTLFQAVMPLLIPSHEWRGSLTFYESVNIP